VRVSLKIPAKATAFSPAGPMDRVRTSGPKRFFIQVSVSEVLLPSNGEASWKLTRPSSTKTNVQSGEHPSSTMPSRPANFSSAPRKPPA
jgi:hypothetical protein